MNVLLTPKVASPPENGLRITVINKKAFNRRHIDHKSSLNGWNIDLYNLEMILTLNKRGHDLKMILTV